MVEMSIGNESERLVISGLDGFFRADYLCRAEDGLQYVVKGRSATVLGCIKEWLCAGLGQAFGLPIPNFDILKLPEELLEYNTQLERDLGNNREERMAQVIRRELKIHHLERQYKQQTFEAKFRKIQLPLVKQIDADIRVIKPLAFDQKDPSKIIEHGALWKDKIYWLLDKNVLVENKVLLPIEAPQAPQAPKGDLREAYNIAYDDLTTLGTELVTFDNKQRIIDFAREGYI